MFHPSDPDSKMIKDARPRFFADVSDDLYWLSDSSCGLLMTFATRRDVVSLCNQMREAFELDGVEV